MHFMQISNAVLNFVDAVKLSSPNSTDREVEDAMKVWLKHAPERLKKQRNNATPEEN